jgi:hypothetical protein
MVIHWGMSVIKCIKKVCKHAVVIGSGDIVEDIIDDFIAKLELKPTVSTLLRLHFRKKYGENE